MTTIACKIYDNEIHLVVDTRITSAGHVKDDMKLEKIIHNNNIYMACCGDASSIVFLEIFSRTNIPESNNVKNITEFLHKFFIYYREATSEKSIDAMGLIIFQGKVFRFNLWSLSVFEITTFDALGSGFYFALSALHLEKTAEEAVELACKLDAFSELPLQKFVISK